MRVKASEVGDWLQQIARKRDHREVLSDDDHLVLQPGPNFDWLMGNSAAGQPTVSVAADPHSGRGQGRRILPCSRGGHGASSCEMPGIHDMCGRPLRSKRNLQERCGPWSGADMCAAFDAAQAHTPQARMGVRGSGPIQAHALEALVVKLVFQIASLDRCAIPLL
jgi:hypothetical protein